MFLNLVSQDHESVQSELPRSVRFALGGIIGALTIALMTALIGSAKAAPDLAVLAEQQLDVSGVKNPVTAVLLNFRSYDTLLEVAVLLIVAVAVLPAGPASKARASTGLSLLSITERQQPPALLIAFLRWLIPLTILVGGYLLWTGAYAPGGAFQAGAVIAGGAVALYLVGHHRIDWQSTSMRVVLCLGLLVFMLIALFSAMSTGTTLQYPTDYAGLLILLVEIAATMSIATILLLLFAQLKRLLDQHEEQHQ